MVKYRYKRNSDFKDRAVKQGKKHKHVQDGDA